MSYFIGTSKAEIKSKNKHILLEAVSSEKLGHEGHRFTQLHNFCYISAFQVLQ
jgi:hypothetical protein